LSVDSPDDSQRLEEVKLLTDIVTGAVLEG